MIKPIEFFLDNYRAKIVHACFDSDTGVYSCLTTLSYHHIFSPWIPTFEMRVAINPGMSVSFYDILMYFFRTAKSFIDDRTGNNDCLAMEDAPRVMIFIWPGDGHEGSYFFRMEKEQTI